MGKALKTVGVIIGAAALIATGVGALAMPALAGTTTLFGVSVGTLNTISSGLVAVGGMLDKPKSHGSAAPDEWTSNPDQPIPFLMGRMGVAGKIVQRDEFGPDSMYQGIVGIISGAGPIRGVTSFAGDKQPVTFGANGIAVTSQWQGEMWMVRRSGAQPDTVLTVPSGLKSGGEPFEWSMAAKLSGKACYLQILGENSKGTAFPAGIPDPVHTSEGIFGYDPRYDDNYPGGAGPCRLGVRSTYRWIDNGGIGALNWALGLVENGQVVGGIGASIDGIDVPAFVEVANIADANVWKLAAWPDTSEDVSAVLDQLLQAAGAVRARHAGKISCVSRGAPRASVATITVRDTAGDIELDTAPSLFNRLNTITPRFMSEAAGWVLTPANPVAFAQYVTDDGGKHGDQIDYRFVPLLKQAAELAAYDILDAREPFSGTIPLKAHMRHLKRGDTFDIDEPGFLMDGVKCIVLSRSYDPKTAQVRIGFRSETDSKHALALGKTTTLPDFPTLTPTDPTFVSPPLPGDWTITPRPPTPGGGQLPGFDLGGIVSNETATAIIVEYGPSATGPWKQAYQGPPTVTTIPIDGLQPGQVYYVAVQYQRNQNYSERYVYGPETAPLLDPSPNAPTIVDLQSQITTVFGDIFDVSELVAQARTDIDAHGVELAAARNGEANLSARIAQVVQAQEDGDQANATLITNLTARTANTEADIIDIENAQANDRTATAEAVSRLTARQALNPNQTPNGNFEGGSAAGWELPAGFGAGYSSFNGGWIAYGELTSGTVRNVQAPLTPVSSSAPAIQSSQIAYRMGSNAYVAASVMFFDAAYNWLDQTPWQALEQTTEWKTWKAEGYTKPAAAAWSRVVITTGGTDGFINLRQAKTEAGPVCTIYSSDASVIALSATATEQSLAIVDLENQQAIAAWGVLAEATGADPAFIGVVSSTLGGYVAIAGPVVALQTTTGGQVKTALKAHDGNVHIADKLYLGDDGLWVFDPVSKTESIRGPGFAKVRGRGFGVNGDLTEWSGPNIAISSMSKANGVRWEDVLGNAYFGGALSAGVLKASDRTSSLSVSASVDTGRYNSHGGTITVTVSLSGGWGRTYYSPSNLAAATETGTVVVSLDRAVNGGAFSDGVATMSRDYSWSRENQGFESGLGYLIQETGGYGGSLTYTDPQQVAQDRQYRARITSFSPITLAGPPSIQDLGVISVE